MADSIDTITRLTSSGSATIKSSANAGEFNRVMEGMLTITNRASSVANVTLRVFNGTTRFDLVSIRVRRNSVWVNSGDEHIERMLSSSQSLEAVSPNATDLNIFCGHIRAAV